MTRTIVLDSGPLGLFLQRPDIPQAAAAQRWIADHLARGTVLVVPEVVDYEVRRELVRLKKSRALARLDEFNGKRSDRYLPITTAAMRRAADLWADVRSRGVPTADPKELDGDAILAAQVLTSDFAGPDTLVATTNLVHLARFLTAQYWSTI